MSEFWSLPQVPTATTGSTSGYHVHSCNCIGPQRGEPRCPCQMRGIIERDGRWIVPEQDLGPVRRLPDPNCSVSFTRPTPTDTGGR